MILDGEHSPQLVADLAAASEALAARLEHDLELWDRAPRGKWSAGQHVQHVAAVLALIADGLERAEQELRAGTLAPPPRRGWLQRRFVRLITQRRTFPRGGKAVRIVKPKPAPERAATLAQLRAQTGRYRTVVERLSNEQRDRLWVWNPFLKLFGWYYMLPELLRVQTLHTRHHLRLVEEVAAARSR